MAVIYREASNADVPEMALIRAAEWGDDDYWRKRILGYLAGEIDPQKARKSRVSYVALENGCVVGFIAGHLTRRYACEGELEWINVAAEKRGSGIAAELLRLLGGWFVQQRAFKICVDVQPTNAVARKFYQRHRAEELNPHWMIWKDIRVVLGTRVDQ